MRNFDVRKNTYISVLAVGISERFCRSFPFFRTDLKIIADFQRFMGYGAAPRCCLQRPPDTLRRNLRNSPLSRAECAVKSPMCDDEPKGTFGFSGALWLPLFRDFRLAENRATKSCLELASRLDFVIRRCRCAVERRQGSKRLKCESVCRRAIGVARQLVEHWAFGV